MRSFVLGLLFIWIAIPFEASSQDTDHYQPDSVYRINKVKSRIINDLAGSPWQTSTSYDSIGRLVLWQLIKDGKPVQKIEYRYGDNGKLLAEIYSGKPTDITYDASGRVNGKSLKGIMEITISYDPFRETKKFYKSNGQIESEVETIYETPFLSKRSRGAQAGEAFDYTYKNTFSTKTGRPIKRESFSGKKKIQTILYQYDTNGLLVQKTTLSDLHPPIIENFEYIYWK